MIALIGDSVFDSRSYMPGLADMAARVQGRLKGGTARLLAVSGSRLASIPHQLARLPEGTTHAVASIGGNDLLDLGRRIGLSGGGLSPAMGLFLTFRAQYASFCAELKAVGVPAAVCTVYLPPIGNPLFQELGATVIQMVNATIKEEAIRSGLSVIDLSQACHRPVDFIDPIHPSNAGADKIANAIAEWVTGLEAATR